MERKCLHCTVCFVPKRKDKVYCTKSCKGKATSSNWRAKNPTYSESYNKSYYQKNRLSLKERKKKTDKEFAIKNGASYMTIKRRSSLEERIKHNLRVRINKAIKGINKAGSAVQELGCSLEEFRKYIYNLFEPGMTWDNYGEWHIDHKTALIKYDLSDPIQFKNACHYTNLQPLWAKDHRIKTKLDLK
jgi:hypothetical protein